MPLKYSTDMLVSFDETTHTYMMGTKRLQGVTSLIKKYKKPFDSDAIATAYATKNELIKADVLKQWKDKSEASIKQGHSVHTLIEDYILQRLPTVEINYKKQRMALKFINDYFESGRLKPVAAELLIHNGHIASMIDCIAVNPLGEYFILDWKTNDKIDTQSFRDERMLAPFDAYPDCSLYHYSMQISIYKILCRDYDIKRGFIVHIKEDGYEIIESKNITIPNKILHD